MSIFHFRDYVCVGVETVNRLRDHLSGRRFLASERVTKRQLQNVAFDRRALLEALPAQAR
ncbi:hypothetical protein EAS61_41635 [Bradyrhizobium zhanjiangense]|uniref:Reductase C-terminal domain-containing protein n=1 Tax=Bradyrhizobium zhanjiangense TaxID=1325107 RepID=A0A4Q0Q3M5_9BRAD|nr:hypothetical protein EAS61_41635 [Bradyrhizobium zhanjiangense]